MGKLLYISAASPLWAALFAWVVKALAGPDIGSETAELAAKIGAAILGGGLLLYLGFLILGRWEKKEGLVSLLIWLASMVMFFMIIGA